MITDITPDALATRLAPNITRRIVRIVTITIPAMYGTP